MKRLTLQCLVVAGWLLLIAAPLANSARAESPPNLPLPPCSGANGEVGACPLTNDNVEGISSGTLTAGGSALVTIDPQLPVCDYHQGYPPYPWAPSPCYSAVLRPVVLGCGYIDLEDDGVWRETSCPNALYRDPADAQFPMFTVDAAEGSSGCGGAGAYNVYVYGGPANVPGARWAEVGPTRLGCEITFNGSRPDGLYGPTWVKLRVGIDRAENGDQRRGYPEYAHMYVPIDGDLREDVVDVSVLATYSLRTEGDAQIVTFTITLTNNGEKAADGVKLIASHEPAAWLSPSGEIEKINGLPSQLHALAFSDNRCAQVNNFYGGSFTCDGIDLAATGDVFGRDVHLIDFEARILNATDLPPLTFEAQAPGDIDESNNSDRVHVMVPMAPGSTEQTRQAMEVLRPHFDYTTDINFRNGEVRRSEFTCNNWMHDTFARFERIRLDHPAVFAGLAYGPVTSGKYFTAAGTSAGHVGVVVYPKGTDYRETGIVIHGLPSPSPLSTNPDRFDTQVSIYPLGEAPAGSLATWTTVTGDLYRTPVSKFPGIPRPENDGCGFEGLYADNHHEFNRTTNCGVPAEAETCPIAPDAMVMTTESPVDLRVTNPEGQIVQTTDNAIVVQELETPIYSMALPHPDGSHGWTLVLPNNDYLVELIGTGHGPYRLTLSIFMPDGEPINTVIEGTTQPGQIDFYEFLQDRLFRDGFFPKLP